MDLFKGWFWIFNSQNEAEARVAFWQDSFIFFLIFDYVFCFLFFVFRFSFFFFCIVVLRQASSARRPSYYSQNEAKREQRPGNSAIFILFRYIRRTGAKRAEASWQFLFFIFILFLFAERSEATEASW